VSAPADQRPSPPAPAPPPAARSAPAPARLRWLRRRARPNPLGELVIIFVLVRVYDVVRSWGAVRAERARHNGSGVLAVERFAHLAWERPGNHWLAGHPGLELVAVYWYQFAHLSVTLAVLVWCYLRSPARYRPARNALVVVNAVGMTVFFLLPVAPPRLLPGQPFVDSVAAAGFGASHGGPVPADQYAAMPSLHLGWAVWTAVLAYRLLRGRARLLVFGYPLVTAVVVVVTANHYVLDVLAGVATGALALWAVQAPLLRRPGQMMRRRISTVSASAPGSSGIQTVISRYPSTAAIASEPATPTASRPASSAASSAPIPPGEGTSAEMVETTR
jgi:hypothetical protein